MKIENHFSARLVRSLQALMLLAFLIGNNALAAQFKQCAEVFFQQTPPSSPYDQSMNVRELCFDSFAVLHSGVSKTPMYSAQRLNRKILEDALDEERTDRFYEEARLPSSHRASLKDYYKAKIPGASQVHRGHLAPAADMPNPNAMAQSFSLANIIPQAGGLNTGDFRQAESSIRKYIRRAQGDVFIITGVYYAGQTIHQIGPSGVWVPTHVYKAVLDAHTGRAWAYWFENTDRKQPPKPISYAALVQKTGIDFFPTAGLLTGAPKP